MKTLFINTILSLFLLFAAQNAAAQEYTSHIRVLDSLDFNKVDLAMDTEVILIQKPSTRVTLAGDSSFINTVPVSIENGTLSINYTAEPGKKLYRVIIEFNDIEQVKTGGFGEYYLHQFDLDQLVVNNPAATLSISGNAQQVILLSPAGYNDISSLEAPNKYLKIGEEATLVNTKETQFVVANF